MINKAIARCVAKLSGDGTVYLGRDCKNGYVRYSNTCKVLREQFKSDMREIFGQICLTEGITNTRTPFVQTKRKSILLFFLEYLNSYKSKDIFIPKQIKKASVNIKSEYLKALYDDEGSPRLRIFKLQEWKRNVTLYSNSKKLVQEVKHMLKKDFKITSNKIYKNFRSDGRISFALDITGQNKFNSFQQKIGFNHPIKNRRMKQIIKSYHCTAKKNAKGFLELNKELKSSIQFRQSSH